MKSLYPWQQPQWRQLLSQHQQGRLAHALLLAGDSGLGKLDFAQFLAFFLLCKTPNEKACGLCSNCHLNLIGNHPDLFYLTPEENGKTIKVEPVRELIAMLNQTSQRIGYRIAIIAPAESLNKAAANALLKSLEEPHGQVIFLLVSHQPGALPATIVSRCQTINFSCTLQTDIWLRDQLKQLQISIDPNLLLKMASYSPLRALSLAKNNYLQLRDDWLNHLLAVSQGKKPLLIVIADFLKQDLLLSVEVFLSLILDILRLRLGVFQKNLTHSDRMVNLEKLAQIHSSAQLSILLDRLTQVRQYLLNSQIHLNDQLLLESILIQWQGDLHAIG